MRQFLELIVENGVSGNGPLKETVIGVQVFGRPADYDPGADPIVRVEARRLRQKLRQYYDREGAADPVIVHLPTGGYAPEFEFRAPADPRPVPIAEPVSRPVGRLRHLWALAALLGLAAFSLWLAQYPRLHPPRAAAAGPLPKVVSIAVLPLANLSGDPAQDYLADGMTDELIGSLAQISSLRVISRTSTMHYKGARKALPDIAKELDVDEVVEGSVTRSGREVRITAQLIEAKADRHLWSQDYRRRIGDLLQIESEVAQAVTAQIRLRLSILEEPRLRRPSEVPPDVGEAYLKGRYFWNRRTENDLRKAICYYQEAVTKAPGYAAAWAGLADSWLLLGETWLGSKDDAYAEAQHAVDKALALDDFLGEAHASRAALESNRGLWQSAEAEYRRALDLSPGYATAHQWYAEGLAAHGRMDEAMAEIRRAQQLDPLSLTVNVQVGYVLFLARRYDDAIAQLRSTIEMDPYFWMAHAVLGHAYEQKRMYPEAIRELGTAANLTNRGAGQMVWLAHAWALAGRYAEARRARAGLEQAFAHEQVGAAPMAALDLAVGEPDRAVSRFQSACAGKTPPPSLGPSPVLDPLRSDPRIAAVLAACAATGPNLSRNQPLPR